MVRIAHCCFQTQPAFIQSNHLNYLIILKVFSRLIEAMTTDRSMGVSFPRTQHRIPLPVERTLYPQCVPEQAAGTSPLIEGILLELYQNSNSHYRKPLMWERLPSPDGGMARCHSHSSLALSLQHNENCCYQKDCLNSEYLL